MNRGQIFYSSLVQQMIGSGGEQGNNNSNSNLWIDMNSSGSGGGGGGSRPGLDEENIAVGAATTLSPLSHHPYHTPPSSYFLPVMAPPWPESNSQEQPESLSLSQLLLSGLSEEERYAYTIAAAQSRKMENNWGDDNKPSVNNKADHHQYGAFNNGAVNGSNQHHEESMQQQGPKSQWNHQQLLPASSPRSCITTTSLGSNLLDFSNCLPERRPHQSDNSSECNSTATGSALKKARVQVTSSAQSTLKVRKERLGDRITALHQIVSPFGKTDTASVLQETIGYIKFLISQIEALTTPYMGGSSSAAPSTAKPMQMQQQPLTLTAQGERNCLFPEYPRQVHQGGSKEEQASTTTTKDLKSRGLCLVPVSCTSHLGTDTSADYWPFGR